MVSSPRRLRLFNGERKGVFSRKAAVAAEGARDGEASGRRCCPHSRAEEGGCERETLTGGRTGAP